MTLKEQLLKILEQHNHPQSAPEDAMFKLLSPYCLHKTLAQGSPYLENDEGVSEVYITECMEIAADMYRRLGFGAALLGVYEDCYSENDQDEIRFVESCLKGIAIQRFTHFRGSIALWSKPIPPHWLITAMYIPAPIGCTKQKRLI